MGCGLRRMGNIFDRRVIFLRDGWYFWERYFLVAGTGHPGVVIWRCEHRPDTHWGLVVITVVAQRAAAGISEDISSQYHGRDIQLASPHCISLLSHTSQYNQTHQAFIWDPCLYRMHRDRTKSENTWTKIQTLTLWNMLLLHFTPIS